jgi:hypothetical protein
MAPWHFKEYTWLEIERVGQWGMCKGCMQATLQLTENRLLIYACTFIGVEEVQAKIRDPRAPTMAETGVLANVAVLEGGHAQGTLGQAGRLKQLVREMTPTKILGEGRVGCVFGGGKALLGEGDQQDCIKVRSTCAAAVFEQYLPQQAICCCNWSYLSNEFGCFQAAFPAFFAYICPVSTTHSYQQP